jgi:DNA replication protein DnaC
MSNAAPTAMLDRIRRHLVALKMPTALERLDLLVQRFEQGQLNPYEMIETLLAEERHLRENRRIKMALLTARLTTLKTLESFDFSFQPSIDRNRILSLAQLQFIERREVVHFLGPPGTGKSHLAVALGLEAVKIGKSVYFTTLGELVSGMAKAEREGMLKERIRFYTRNALLIIDEIGYLPLQSGGANLFFQLINARYERGAMILTSNRGFGEWADIFGDPVVASALLDRLLHHAIVIAIEGNSYRLREHAELVPEPLRTAGRHLPQAPPIPEIKRPRGRPPKSAPATIAKPRAGTA